MKNQDHVSIPKGRYVVQVSKVWPKKPDQNEADPWNVRGLMKLDGLPEGEDTVEIAFDIPAEERVNYNKGDTLGLEGSFKQYILPDGTPYRTETWSPSGRPDITYGGNLFFVFSGTPHLLKRGVQLFGGELSPEESIARFKFDPGA